MSPSIFCVRARFRSLENVADTKLVPIHIDTC